MSENERKLLEVILARSFKVGTFQLASGDTSDYYIDGKMTQVSSEGARLIGEVFYEHTKDLEFDAIGGLEVGAVPLATATVLTYALHGRDMEGFWVRNKAKTHGTQKLIEGNLRPNSRVVIVEDVVTRGESAVKAIKEVREIGCEVVLVLALVDRLAGAGERFREHGIENYRSVFTINDLLAVASEAGNTVGSAAD